jgi:hypothetical protein
MSPLPDLARVATSWWRLRLNEILGTGSGLGVPNVTVNLSKGDVIDIGSLRQVTMTPS